MKKNIFTIIGIILSVSLFSQAKDTICQSFNLYIDSTNATLETYVYKNCNSQEFYIHVGVDFPENDSTYHQTIDSIDISWVINDTLTIEGNPLIYNFNNSEINTIRYYAIDQMACYSGFEQTYYQNYPIFDFSNVSLSDDTVNVGDTVYLLGIALNYSSYTNFSNPMYIPDGTQVQFIDTINVIGTGDTINNIIDIPDICVNIEHSFISDLDIEITCPNGTTVMLEQQGGGGVFLGEPIDTYPESDTLIGIGWDYCWSYDPMYGEMDEEANNGIILINNSLPSGSYQSYDDLSNLIGCPLDGDWILTITDNWSIDDGFLFNWGISNNNSSSQFSYFIFNNIENNDTVMSSTLGLNQYNLEIHQGTCVYDTVLSVFVESGLYIDKDFSSNIDVFPNPANRYININNIDKESVLYVYDLSGQVVMINELKETNNNVNVSKLSEGIYYCKIIGPNNYVFKLVVN